MNWQLFKEKFVPRILKMAGLDSTYVNRNAAGNILAAAVTFSAEKGVPEKLVLKPYMELCLDSSVGIRKLALTNLKFIIEKTLISEVERIFFNDLLVHLKDPNPSIRALVFDLIIKFEDRFSDLVLKNELVPLLDTEFANGWKDTDNWLLQHCGLVVNFLLKRHLLAKERVINISKYFEQALNSTEMHLNLISITNIVPMIEMNLWHKLETSRYTKTLHEFGLGPLYHQHILGVLPELIRVHFEYKKMNLVRSILIAFMQNEDQDFAVSLISCFTGLITKILHKHEGDKEVIDEFFRKQLLKWIKGVWIMSKTGPRKHVYALIELIPSFQDSFNGKEYNEYFLQEMVEVIRSGNKVEQKLASNTFCLLYLKNYHAEVRNAALEQLIKLAQENSCLRRQAVLSFISVALDHFSVKLLVQSKLITAYLTLGRDKVVNVRIQFTMIAKKAINVLDNDTKSLLKSMLIVLQNDKAKDVKILARQALKKPLKRNEEVEIVRQQREQELIKHEQVVLYIINH
jgi:hypothetical protein